MRKKILAVIIICVCMVSISLNVFSFNEINANEINSNNTVNNTNEVVNKTLEQQKQEIDKNIEDSTSKLEYVKGELTATVQKIAELDDSITDYESKYNELYKQISTLESEIDETNKSLEELEDEYARKEKTLKKRIVALYEAGDTSYMDLLFSSSNLIEFISNYFMISELLEYDNELLNNIENMQIKMEQKKAEQEQKNKELKTSKSQITETQIQLENTKIVKQNYMAGLTEEEKAVEEEIAKYKLSQAELENKIAAATEWVGTYSIQFSGGLFIWPVAMEGTYITSAYGNRLHPVQGVYKNHAGIDISGPNINGGPGVAAADGVVTFAGWISGYGNCVIINHGSGIVTLYGHGMETVAKTGDIVKQGDIILKIGSTGVSTGPHIHFEVRKNGIAVDPIPYLNGEISAENINENNINNIQSIVIN